MKFQFAVCGLFAISLLGGCAGPQRKVTPLTHEESSRPAPILAPAEPESPPPAPTVEIEPKPKPVVTEPAKVKTPVAEPPEIKPAVVEPAEVKPAAAQPVTGWVSLQDWCAEHKLAAPQITTENGQTNIVIRSDNGVFAFEPPRRNARWNGILVGIGFSPVFTNHQTFANALDLNKVLQPLLLTSNDAPRKQGGIVVIDAGHGGPKDGAVSRDKKLKEKDLTLDWARRVQKLLDGSPWHVVMTRMADTDIGLSNRVAVAEQNKADLFISLHFNSFTNRAESGIETYCMTPVGMISHVARNYGDDPTVAVPNNEFDIDNFLLAYDLHRAMLRKTGHKDRGVRRARFMTVLRDQKRPAVLLEGGYLSNPDEAKLIATPEYRQKLAEAVAEALGVTPPAISASTK
jgi:N-acetylmuramoyl-L-alanine amidase